MQSLLPCAALGTPQDAADVDETVHERCTDKKHVEYSERLLTNMPVPPPIRATQNARRLRSGCAVMMQAAMMLSADDFALPENRRNFPCLRLARRC